MYDAVLGPSYIDIAFMLHPSLVRRVAESSGTKLGSTPCRDRSCVHRKDDARAYVRAGALYPPNNNNDDDYQLGLEPNFNDEAITAHCSVLFVHAHRSQR